MKNKGFPFRGHQYNPVTGFIDRIENNGDSTPLFQVTSPKPKLNQTCVYGVMSKSQLAYNMGPSDWKHGMAIVQKKK